MVTYKFGKIAVAARQPVEESLLIVKDDFEDNTKATAARYIQSIEINEGDPTEFQIIRIYPEVYKVETQMVQQRTVNVVDALETSEEPAQDDYNETLPFKAAE